jgi:Family of unknown function (DUF5856)
MAAELFALLFLTRDWAHRAHLKTQSYSQHMALQGLYEEVTDLTDRLVEAYQGRYGIVEIPYMDAPKEQDTIAVVTNLLTILEGARYSAIDSKDTALHNIIDEIVGVFLSTLYKLKNLK